MTAQEIAAFLKSLRPSASASVEEILASSDLFRDGWLDSLVSLRLLQEIERGAKIRISPLLVTKKSLSSVGAILLLMEHARSGA